jgi:hypothetical protein
MRTVAAVPGAAAGALAAGGVLAAEPVAAAAVMPPAAARATPGLEYLPAVARRLHHGRDLGEPFDFLTWFEFAPEHTAAFDELVRRLRETEEWIFVEREIDLRLAR